MLRHSYNFPAIQTAYVPVDLPVKQGLAFGVRAIERVRARMFYDEVAQARAADPLDSS